MNTYVRLDPDMLARHTEQYLLQNLGRHVTLDELIAQFGVSGTTLKKHFRENHGMSLYAWFKSQRMQAAARELRDTKDSILKIAGDFGYENASKFSAAFRDVFDVSPREYRRTLEASKS